MQVGTNHSQAYDFIREFTDRPMHTLEAVAGTAARQVLDVAAGLLIVLSGSGCAARTVCKYRPAVPVLVVTDSEAVARACAPLFAAWPHLVPSLDVSR